MAIVILIQWLVLGLAILFQYRQAKLNVFHPALIYILFHALVFVIHPTLSEIFGFHLTYEYMRFYPSEDVRAKALIVADIGLISFLAASSFVTARAAKQPVFPEAASGWTFEVTDAHRRALLYTALLFLPIIVYSTYDSFEHPLIVQRHFGSIDSTQVTQSARTGAVLFTDTTSYLLQSQFLGGPLVVAWAMINKYRLRDCLPFAAYSCVRLFDSGGRINFVYVVAAFGLGYLVVTRRSRITASILVGATVIAIMFGALSDRILLRRVTGFLSPVQSALYYEPAERTHEWSDQSYLDGEDFANYEYLSFIVYVVPAETNTYTYFTQYLTLFIKPIPRVLWPEKPERDLIPILNLNDFGRFDVLTTSIIGDGWLSLGYIGVVITLALVAAACGWAYRRFAVGHPTPFFVVGYCLFLCLTPQWFRDGGTSISVFLGISLLPIWVWFLVYRWISRTAPVHTNAVTSI